MMDDGNMITGDVDDLRDKKKPEPLGMGVYWGIVFGIIVIRCLNIFIMGELCETLDYEYDLIIAFVCGLFILFGSSMQPSGFAVGDLFTFMCIFIFVTLFLFLMASISSSVWGSCPGKPSGMGRDILQAKLKSQWNRFLDDIGVIGVIRQFDYDAFLTLEELLVGKPYYTGDPDDGGPRDKDGELITQKDYYQKAMEKSKTDKEWARGWDREKINRCFLFDKHIRDGYYTQYERTGSVESPCNKLEGLEQINNMYKFNKTNLIKPPDPDSLDDVKEMFWKRIELPVDEDCESYVYQTSWFNKNTGNLDKVIKGFAPPKYLKTSAFKK